MLQAPKHEIGKQLLLFVCGLVFPGRLLMAVCPEYLDGGERNTPEASLANSLSCVLAPLEKHR